MKLHSFILSAAFSLLIYKVHAQQPAHSVAVHFAFDKSDINSADLQALQSFKSSHPNIESIVIDGYADTTGTDNYNYALSLRRCDAAKKALGYDENITEVVLRIGAHGEKDLLYKTDPENRVVIVAMNDKRIAEIRLAKQQQLAAVAAPVKELHTDSEVVQQPSVETKPVVQTKNVTLAQTVLLMPKVMGDNATGLLKLLQDSKAGESIVLDDIHFEEGRHVLLKSSKPALNAMLDALKKMPSLQLEIQGHICCDDMLAVDGLDIDTKEFQLSYNRAKTVYDFMVQNGIDASRLSYKGFGTRKRIVYPEASDKDRNKNRRVEFLIVKK